MTTQHGVLKSPGTITLPDRSEQAGPCPKEENSVTHSASPRNNVNAPPPYLQSINVIIKITETNQGLPPAPPAVLPCSGEPPAGMTGELFAGNGLLSNVSSVPTHNAAALSYRLLSDRTEFDLKHRLYRFSFSLRTLRRRHVQSDVI